MARIYEYQGKQLLKTVGVPIPRGEVVSTPQEAKRVAKEIGRAVAIKSQVWATGRFKAGGIQFAETPKEAERVAEKLLGSQIKGLSVEKVLVEERLDVDKEFYIGVIVDNSYKVKAPVLVFCTEGGVDVEEVVLRNPERVSRVVVDYLRGVGPSDAQALLSKVNLDSGEMVKAVCGLYEVFKQYDARVAEINPLVSTKDGRIYAADCRITLDDNSIFRHPEFGIQVPRDMEREPTELEKLAWMIEEGDFRGTGYFAQMVTEIEGEGYVGFHGIGGGGAMLGASALINRGLKIADYADTSGDPPASKVYRVIKAILSQPIDGYILMGACLANQEQWHHAHGIVKILKEELKDRPGFPVLLLIAGNKERETHEIIKQGLKDLPIRWELYGRDYIYQTEFIADRFKELLDEYLKEKQSKKGKR
jgi:succinyl-CoA synthetase beta subunit